MVAARRLGAVAPQKGTVVVVFGRKRKDNRKSQGAPAPVDDDAPGWDALEAHLRRALGDADPTHWAGDTLPGQEGLSGVSAYPADGHWLYVTFGLSELFAKQSDDADVSGWGIELTMRLPRDSHTPPEWPVGLLAQLGRYVYSTATPFAAGHRAGGDGLPTGDPNSRLAGVAFATDPQLAALATPNGRVEFLTAVGVTGQELERMRDSSTLEVLEGLQAVSPLLVTDPART